jgi:hypothetical protein
MRESAVAIHTRVGNDYRKWKHTAERLFVGSKMLNRERERVRRTMRPPCEAPSEIFTLWISLMLTAFGIECLIKAIWLKQGHQLARDGKYVEMIKHERHQLVELCGAARIALDSRQTQVLQRISEIAGSIGRYPIGRRSSEADRGRVWSGRYDRVIEDFIAKLQTQLNDCYSDTA